MALFTVSGEDTLVLGGRVFADLATDDVTTIELPNELVNIKTGKNGNSIIAQNFQGLNGNLMIKVNRGSSDDQFLQAQANAVLANFVGTTLLAGSFTKDMGDGQGNVVGDVYTLAGGIVSKIPGAKDNASGDVAQAETTYNVKFTNVGRSFE